MKGYFYAAQNAAELAALYPQGFISDEQSGELRPISPLVYRSVNGVWLTKPVFSSQDEEGNTTVVTPGVRSDPYVVISALPVEALSAFLVSTEGETLA